MRFGSAVLGIVWILTMVVSSNAFGASDVLALHSPIQPLWGESVTYTVTVTGVTGIQSIKIFTERRQLTACVVNQSQYTQPPCSNPLDPADPQLGTWRSVQSCGANLSTCTAIASYQTPVDFVGYKAVVTYLSGGGTATIDEGPIYYAVGTYPWADSPGDPIPIYLRDYTSDYDAGVANLARKVDLIFIPDAGDYPNPIGQFRSDVGSLMKEVYFDKPFAQEIRSRRAKYNFYLTYHPGDAACLTCVCPTLDPPAEWTNMLGTVDTGLILHKGGFVDCTQQPGVDGNTFSGDPFATTTPDFVPVVHETGHAIYGLSDEYCSWSALGGRFEATEGPPNAFASEGSCENVLHSCAPIEEPQTPNNRCRAITQCGTWYRADVNNDIMRDTGSDQNVFGACCVKRIRWKHEQKCDHGYCR
jgi:hypothetical protein